jgi:hypothetical protein
MRGSDKDVVWKKYWEPAEGIFRIRIQVWQNSLFGATLSKPSSTREQQVCWKRVVFGECACKRRPSRCLCERPQTRCSTVHNGRLQLDKFAALTAATSRKCKASQENAVLLVQDWVFSTHLGTNVCSSAVPNGPPPVPLPMRVCAYFVCFSCLPVWDYFWHQRTQNIGGCVCLHGRLPHLYALLPRLRRTATTLIKMREGPELPNGISCEKK